jgi:hypothetical protein
MRGCSIGCVASSLQMRVNVIGLVGLEDRKEQTKYPDGQSRGLNYPTKNRLDVICRQDCEQELM